MPAQFGLPASSPRLCMVIARRCKAGGLFRSRRIDVAATPLAPYRVKMLTAVLLATAAIPAGRPFNCMPTRVWDGDGPVWCREGPRLRLAGIAAREHDGTCRANQPCPRASAEVARDTLVRLLGKPNGRSRQGHILVRGPTLRCVSNGSAGRGRTGAWCVSPTNGDVSCAMVTSGTVLRWQRYWRRHRC